MLLRFGYEAFCGITALISILILGKSGAAGFAMLGILPIILRAKKIRFDERELQIFYKAGNYSAGIVITVLAAGYILKNSSVNLHIPENWILLLLSFIIFVHGLFGLIILKRN